jgi:hypothetical protein
MLYAVCSPHKRTPFAEMLTLKVVTFGDTLQISKL